MKILIDTNILLDFYAARPDFYDTAAEVINACVEKRVDGCVAAHSITNAFYVLRHSLSSKERRNTLKDLCKIVTVVGIDEEKLIAALDNEDFFDFEDCLQTECAKAFHADYIVTRDVKDYVHSEVHAILPEDFLKVM